MFSSNLEVTGTPPQPYNNDPTPYGENDTFPERQINSATENITLPLFGTPIKATGGFMEPHGHGYKSEARYFIDSSNLDHIQRIDPGYYNIGVDYVVQTPDQDAQNWYSGTVSYATTSDGGYGQSVYIDSDVQYVLNGNSYPVKLAYSHLDEIDPAITAGARVDQGQRIGEMGGTGTTPNAYPEHVDFRAWIEVPRSDGQGLREIYISPDALSQNLLQQQYGLRHVSAEETTRIALENSPKPFDSSHTDVSSQTPLQMWNLEQPSSLNMESQDLRSAINALNVAQIMVENYSKQMPDSKQVATLENFTAVDDGQNLALYEEGQPIVSFNGSTGELHLHNEISAENSEIFSEVNQTSASLNQETTAISDSQLAVGA